MQLRDASGKVLVPKLQVAKTTWTRMKGLLGRSHLDANEALWIWRCREVHTFFMRFAIDLIFLDRDLVVKKTVSHVGPGRIVWPVWGASSVVELSAGFLEKNPVRVGEKLNVDSSLS